MKLYELTSDFTMLFDQFDAINDYVPDTNADGQPINSDGDIIENVEAYKNKMLTAWFDTLEGVEGEFDIKAENMAAYIKTLLAEEKMLKEEKQVLEKRQQQKKKQVESLKTYLLNSMTAIGRKKIETSKAVLSIRNNPLSLVVDDEFSFIKWAKDKNLDNSLLEYTMPKIKKAEIKKLCKQGEDVPFIHLEAGLSLQIK